MTEVTPPGRGAITAWGSRALPLMPVNADGRRPTSHFGHFLSPDARYQEYAQLNPYLAGAILNASAAVSGITGRRGRKKFLGFGTFAPLAGSSLSGPVR